MARSTSPDVTRDATRGATDEADRVPEARFIVSADERLLLLTASELDGRSFSSFARHYLLVKAREIVAAHERGE